MLGLVKLLSLASVLTFAVQAQATSLHPDTFANKPLVNDVKIIVKGLCDPSADVCMSVEPWVEISFTHTSCATMPFEISKSETLAGPVNVSLVIPSDAHDCHGPTHPHTYVLQLETAFQHGQTYRLVNPIGVAPTI